MIKDLVKKYLFWLYRPVLKAYRHNKAYKHHILEVSRLDEINAKNEPQRIFYLGITEHSNLGDNAQFYCIRRWIKKNYPDIPCYEFESTTICDHETDFIKKFMEVYKPQDIIIFQSGYCTQDLGGNHEEMHRLICDNLPHARILMMPQTIFFQKEENKLRTSKSYNQAHNMLFLARDKVSYEIALEMFPDIKVELYPDIVTTLIGTLKFDNPRNGVCLCTRNDGEKYYSEEEIEFLKHRIESEGVHVKQKDTYTSKSYQKIRKNQQAFIENEIETFSHFNVTITDRYHGTIFSLAAGTPVIIIKTNDHKVVTGADWFKGIYDDYVYVVKDLDEAFTKYKELNHKKFKYSLIPYFENQFYNLLKSKFEIL